MKRVVFRQPGGIEVLEVEDAPVPEPGVGQVRVKIEAAGVNFIDIYQRIGQYKVALPHVPGMEAAGTVDALGPDVQGFAPGDRVAYAFVPGAYAEYALVPAEKCVHVPQGVTMQEACTLMIQGMTAHYLSHSTVPLAPGHTVLIHAAAGGTGQLLVQMAKLAGASVIGTVSTEGKAALARTLGADEVILYSEQDFEAEVKRITEGRGVDVVYDSVGKDTFDKSLNCLRPRGYMVLFGQSSGPVPSFDPQILNAKGSLYLTRPTLGHYLLTRAELLERANAVFGWAAAGKLHVRVDRVFALEDAGEAQNVLNNRGTLGKLLISPMAATPR